MILVLPVPLSDCMRLPLRLRRALLLVVAPPLCPPQLLPLSLHSTSPLCSCKGLEWRVRVPKWAKGGQLIKEKLMGNNWRAKSFPHFFTHFGIFLRNVHTFRIFPRTFLKLQGGVSQKRLHSSIHKFLFLELISRKITFQLQETIFLELISPIKYLFAIQIITWTSVWGIISWKISFQLHEMMFSELTSQEFLAGV